MPVVAAPGLVAVAAALLGLLILWGVMHFAKAVAGVIPKGLPIIGDSLHNLVLAGAAVASAAIQWLMAEVIRPVINFVLAPVFRFLDFMAGLAHAVRTMATSWSWLLNSALPSIITKLSTLAHRLVAAARTYAHHLYMLALAAAIAGIDALRAGVWAGIHAVRAYSLSLYHLAVTVAAHALSAVSANLWHGIALARVYAATLVSALRADMHTAVAEAEAIARAGISTTVSLVKSTAATTLAASEHYTDLSIATVLGGVSTIDIPAIVAPWDGLIDDIGTLEGVIATDFPDIRAALGELDLTGTLDATLAISTSLVMSRVMTRYLRQCGIPNCRNLGGLGHFLNDLLGAAGLAALLAMIHDMIEDPGGAAQRTADELSGVVATATGLAHDLLGV